MNTRFNYVAPPKRDSSNDDIFYKWELVKRIRVLSTNKDGSVDKYEEEEVWKKEKCSWKEFIDSFDIGPISKQVMDHLTKGTPLITAHTLPAGDYTNLSKGAEIKREMQAKGITLDMIAEVLAAKQNGEPVTPDKQVESETK